MEWGVDLFSLGKAYTNCFVEEAQNHRSVCVSVGHGKDFFFLSVLVRSARRNA